MAGDHRCEVCGATFTRPQHVGRHMRSHTGDKPYACPHCPDRFARSDLLSRHVNKTHCPPDPNAPVQPGRKKKAKEVAPHVQPSGNAPADRGVANHIVVQPTRVPQEDGLSANVVTRLDGRWRHESNSSGDRPSVPSSPQYQQHLPMQNQQQQHYQQYQQQQQLQTMGWVGTGVNVGPLGGGDVIERLAAGTGELDGDESEDDDLWDGLSGQPGMYQSTNGFPMNPTIQQMANMQLHQVPTGIEMDPYANQAYPNMQPASQMPQLHQQPQQQAFIYQADATRNYAPMLNQADNTDFMASPQRNMSFGSWYQPISPGLMAAPPIRPVHEGSKGVDGQQRQTHQSPVNIGSSPMINPVSLASDGRAVGPGQSLSPSSSAIGRPIDIGASLSPSSSSSGQHASPFGDGYSSNMPALPENGNPSVSHVYINRPAKKRACEQCNTSKVRCDSQLPCQKCTMRGIRCTYPIAKKLGRKSLSDQHHMFGTGASDPQPWMYMPGQEPFVKPDNPVDRRSSIHFGTANTASPMAANAAIAHAGIRNSFSALQSMPPSHFARLRDSSLDDDAVSLTSGFTTSHADNTSRRESMADSILAVEDETGAGLLHIMDIGIAPAVIEGAQLDKWPSNGIGNGMEAPGTSRPGFPAYHIDGTVSHRPPSLSDVKDAWRQFAAGQQPISIGGLVPGPQTRPTFLHRARSNSVPEVYPKHLVDLAVTDFASDPRAEVESFNFARPTAIVASPADIQTGSASPASALGPNGPFDGSKPQSIMRGSSGNSSVNMVEAILPASGDPNNALFSSPSGQDQNGFVMDSVRNKERGSMNQSIARPSIAVFQPTAAGTVARHILQQGGSQTLAPERAPSFINASFLDTDRNKFKVPGFVGQSGFYAQPIVSTKMSSLTARPGNKRLPSQTLGPDYQKKLPIGGDAGQTTAFGSIYPPSPLAGTPTTLSAQQTHARRYSVPGWLGGTTFGQNEFVDSESSFLQAAFPGTMALPEFTPTQNPLLGAFPFPTPNYT